jgi:hypothetical protein
MLCGASGASAALLIRDLVPRGQAAPKRGRKWVGPGSAVHHFVLHRARDKEARRYAWMMSFLLV